jgi:hypothetical protein
MLLLQTHTKSISAYLHNWMSQRGKVYFRWQSPLTVCVAWMGLSLAAITPPHGTGVTVCWFKQCTGIDCIGCGLTRSLSCGLRGMLAESFSYHPFGPFILALFLFTAVLSLAPSARRQVAEYMEARPMWFNGLYLAFVVAFVGFGTVRALIEVFQRASML